MTGYIKRSDAIQCARDVANDFKNEGFAAEAGGADTVGDWLQDFPADEDVRPVVLCRDCKYYNDETCDRWSDGTYLNPNDFCSRAARI